MSAPQLPIPTWFAGCGNMGQAIVAGWRAAGLDLSSAVAIRPSGAPVAGLRTVTAYAEAGPPPKLVILGFKPQKLADAAAQLGPWVTSRTVIVSLLASVECGTLRNYFPKAQAVVRAMPNLPVSVRRGVVALAGDPVADEVKVQLSGLFAALGFAPWMADEARLAAVGSVAGAGPAYVARFIAALAKAGEQRGLSAEMAATIALETVLGTAWLAAAESETMEAIARRVASPNGTTEAGLAVLDCDRALDELIALTIEAASRRGAELAAEARGASLAADAPLP